MLSVLLDKLNEHAGWQPVSTTRVLGGLRLSIALNTFEPGVK